ncbi:hypothetical protein ACSD7O_22300 [Methylorubrum extorquens]|uniref:hypothetical protein n=1 Tax=Methylorubrum extorquens TaxID=408 RepID=UPI003F602C39
MKRIATALITPLVRFVEWLFGPTAAGVDLALSLFAGGWAGLMIARPQIFDHGTFKGMYWMADEVWIAFFTILATLHVIGLFRPLWREMRCAAALVSAWIWISVSASFATIEITTGVLTYTIIGAGALCGAIYLSGQPRKVG